MATDKKTEASFTIKIQVKSGDQRTAKASREEVKESLRRAAGQMVEELSIDSSLLALLYVNMQLDFVGTCDFFLSQSRPLLYSSNWAEMSHPTIRITKSGRGSCQILG